jgi:N-acetylneuraminic acid mutarotase
MKLILAVLILVFSLSFAAGASVPPAYSDENYWIIKTPMHVARVAAGIAAVNETIYVFGGSQTLNVSNHYFSTTINATESYNLIIDAWTEKASMPTSRSYFGTAVYQNRIYCIGGLVLSGNGIEKASTRINEVYDPRTDTWETKTPMPTARYGFEANTVDDKIYVIGGWVQSESIGEHVEKSPQVDIYDPLTDQWSFGKSMPTAVACYSSAVVDDRIYVISGISIGSAITNITQIYDPKMDEWFFGASIPMGVKNAGAGAIAGNNMLKAIYVVGGSSASAPLNGQIVNQVYFVEADSWGSAEPMPLDKSGLRVAVVNNTLFAVGGGHNIFTPSSTTNMQYMPLAMTPEPFPEILFVVVITLIVVCVGLGLLVYLIKRKR